MEYTPQQFATLQADLEEIGDGSSRNLPIEAEVRVEGDALTIRFTFLSQSYTAKDILTEKGYSLQQQSSARNEYNVIGFPV